MRTQINDQIHSASTAVQDANDRVLDSVLETNRRVVDFMVTQTEQFPTLPIELPYADRLPTAADAGKQYIEFVERAVEMNRDFTARVIEMIPEFEAAPAPKTTPKTAPKTTAKPAAKTAPKKARKTTKPAA